MAGDGGNEGEDGYLEAMDRLQLAMVETQQWLIGTGARVLVIFEGRDAAGKDGAIKTLTANMSARNTRIVALPKPTDRERGQWYFQRFVSHLPSAGEFVIFNRSWYNRAGVEPVMGFCTREQSAEFLKDVTSFEDMLAGEGLLVIKLWLDISRREQRERLEKRRTDPMKALKVSPLDAKADEKWDDYTRARDEMLARTSSAVAPWITVRGNSKKDARLAVQAHILDRLACPSLSAPPDKPDPKVLAPFAVPMLSDGWLER
jgi:polyphosphate kinase